MFSIQIDFLEKRNFSLIPKQKGQTQSAMKQVIKTKASLIHKLSPVNCAKNANIRLKPIPGMLINIPFSSSIF